MIYKWTIPQIDVYPEYEGYEDVVFTVHWRLDGTQEDYFTGVYGSVGLTLDPEAEFKPYDELTEEEVIQWVKDALGEEQVSSYEENIQQQLEALINPTVTHPPLPWSN